MLETSPSTNTAGILPSGFRKKLIEVALPLQQINAAAKKEKTITNGHPSTFHLWWGHRPFSVARALIFANLVDDPSSRPDLYPTREEQDRERKALFDLISRLAEWKNSFNDAIMSSARKRLRDSSDGNQITIVDPFSGRGTIPVEAQRLGCNVLASDLNPVAVIVSKALVEIPSRFPSCRSVNPSLAGTKHLLHGPPALAADVEAYGDLLLTLVRNKIGNLYPDARSVNGSVPILAWLWARTVKCPNPICEGAITPLLKSNILSKKQSRTLYLRPMIDRAGKSVSFEVDSSADGLYSNVIPKKGARCIYCDQPISLPYIREATSRGELGQQLIGGVVEIDGKKSFYGSEQMVGSVPPVEMNDTLMDIDLVRNSRHMGPTVYGLTRHRDLYTRRQLVALSTFSQAIGEVTAAAQRDGIAEGLADDGVPLSEGGSGATAYAEAIATYLGIAVSRLADRCSTLAFWQADESVGHVFVWPALSMTWDFVEPNPLAESAGSFRNSVKSVAKTLSKLTATSKAVVENQDCRLLDYPKGSVIITDPPYYDNIPYADISDYFYVWLRASLGNIWPDLFASLTTSKNGELTFNPSRFMGDAQRARAHFSDGFAETFRKWRQNASNEFPTLVFYAFRATEETEFAGTSEASVVSEGWESILDSLIGAGYQITGTWPIGTERGNRFRSIESNALASSIVLVCRPRAVDAPLCARSEFIRELRAELPTSVQRLRDASLAATDLQQAALGPGMAVFSKYSKVLEVDDSPMSVRAALAILNDELAQILLGEIADVDADTHFALVWFDRYGYSDGKYGDADILLKAKNAGIDSLLDAGVAVAEKGRVRLKAPSETLVADDSDAIDAFPAWAQTMHMMAALLGDGGETRAARLLSGLDAADASRIKDIAYHCYLVCDRLKRSSEALDFNALVTVWPELQRRASERVEETFL